MFIKFSTLEPIVAVHTEWRVRKSGLKLKIEDLKQSNTSKLMTKHFQIRM